MENEDTAPEGMEDVLDRGKRRFELAQEVEADNRNEALDDLKFSRLSEQWPQEVRRQRELEGRPCLTINKLPTIIRQVVNDSRMNKPSIKVHPADDTADPETAEIFNGLIRNIEVTSDADVAYDTAIDSAVTCGLGYFRINTKYATDDTFDLDIVIERISNPFAVFGDPYSTAADGSDWNDCFIVDTIPKKEFERRYKGKEPIDWSSSPYTGLKAPWIDDDNVMIVEWWSREESSETILLMSDGQVVKADVYEEQRASFEPLGVVPVSSRETPCYKVTQRTMTGAEVLEEVPWGGKFIPVVPVYGDEVNVEGKRHFRSLIRDAKDAQRMFNYWRTTSTELVALAPKAPFIGEEGAFDIEPEKWASANTQTHAYLQYKRGSQVPQRQPFTGVPAGALQEALNASDDIKAITGLYDASMGARSNETSGVAIQTRQREGDVSTFHFIDNLSRSIRHAGRILLDLIPKVYSTERIVRVMGEGDEPRTVPIGPEPRQEIGPDGNLLRIYSLAVGKYDLTVSSGPSFTTRRQEAAQQMIELIRAYPDAAPIIGDLLAKNLDWPGADEIAERLKAMLPPQIQAAIAQQGQGGQPQQGQPQQAQPEQQQPDPAKMAQASVKQYEAQVKAQQGAEKLRIDAFQAETARMKAVHEIQQPTRLPRMPG